MKKFIALFTILLFGLIACTEDSNLVTQDSSFDGHSLAKGKKGSKGDDPVQDFYTASKEIDGKKGGSIKLKVSMDKSTGQKSEVKLKIPKGAFEGIHVISFTIRAGAPDIVFDPHGLEFKKPLELDLKLENFWFGKKDKIDFVYGDDEGNKLEDVEYDKIDFNHNKNFVKVKKAKVKHFSRYYFCVE